MKVLVVNAYIKIGEKKIKKQSWKITGEAESRMNEQLLYYSG